MYTWLIRFKDHETFDAMQHAVTSALFESKHGRGAWGKLKDDEREYARSAFVEDAEMEDQLAEELEEEEDDEEDEEEDEGAVESGKTSIWALLVVHSCLPCPN